MSGYNMLNQTSFMHIAFIEFICKHSFTAVKLCIPPRNENVIKEKGAC